MFHSIDDESFVTILACNKYGEMTINETSSKKVLCKNCQTRQLRINYTTKLNMQLRKSLVTYTCHSKISNLFKTHTNRKITAIKFEKKQCADRKYVIISCMSLFLYF